MRRNQTWATFAMPFSSIGLELPSFTFLRSDVTAKCGDALLKGNSTASRDSVAFKWNTALSPSLISHMRSRRPHSLKAPTSDTAQPTNTGDVWVKSRARPLIQPMRASYAYLINRDRQVSLSLSIKTSALATPDPSRLLVPPNSM